jgi:flagellar protein FlgJ
MGQSSVAGFARALQAEGYATDNQYAAKIIGIAQSPMMSGVLQALGADTGVAAPINTTAPSP